MLTRSRTRNSVVDAAERVEEVPRDDAEADAYEEEVPIDDAYADEEEVLRDDADETREPTPEWLVQLIRSKNGGEAKKIIQKKLTATDVSLNHNRLSMPISKIVDLDFLNPTEEEIIQEHVNKVRSTGVDAKLVGYDRREFEVNLRRWNMRNTSTYNLVSGWKRVVQCYLLKKNAEIRLWSFHSNGELYFALVSLPQSSDSDEPISEEDVNYEV